MITSNHAYNSTSKHSFHTASAESKLNLAIEIAQEQNAKAWELRAAIELARLLREQERTDEVIALLKPVSDSISDGDCLDDQAVAQSLLTELTKSV